MSWQQIRLWVGSSDGRSPWPIAAMRSKAELAGAGSSVPMSSEFGQERKFIVGNLTPVPITGEAQSKPAFGLAAVLQGPLYLYSEPVVS